MPENQWKRAIHSNEELLKIQGRQLRKTLKGVDVLIAALKEYERLKLKPHIARRAIKHYKELTEILGD